MESSNNLEIRGNLQTNSLAELLYEIACSKFDGSLRLSNDAEKTVIYLAAGKPIFAVSNARCHRLFNILLQSGKISEESLLAVTDFTNDLALRNNLLKNDLLAAAEIDALFEQQINDIMSVAISWQTGEWIFSPLVRVKDDLRFQVNLNSRLIEFARTLPAEKAAAKFKDSHEPFTVISPLPAGINLTPHEWFVYSRFENSTLTRDEIQSLSGLPETETCRILYSLCLGGLVNRKNRHTAFSERYISFVASANLAVKKEEAKPVIQPPVKVAAAPPIKSPPSEAQEVPPEAVSTEVPILLEDYLVRVENAANFYEYFDVPHDLAVSEIKKNYFGLAKRFHPDLFRKEADASLHQRIQNAFTKLAQAYDTLKNDSSREIYDYKMRKEIAEMIERQRTGETVKETDTKKQIDQAAKNFDQGFNYLMDDDYEAAMPYLARAVFFDKDNARYHAYLGKVLAADERQSHRAEAELQTAVKLDSQNADYRIMLAEFFVEIGFLKRAEGELNRLLTMAPNNQEARRMLDSLKRK